MMLSKTFTTECIYRRLLKTMEVYATKTGKWKVLPSELCCGRKAMGTAVFEGKIWIAGGLMQADKEITLQVVSHVDCYDPKQKRYSGVFFIF
ncbi:hypothetical protein AVEN_237494-1 [Araneus ventricosus]|uniref:Uncharacterized protein n=1 Tax=Araneus ventricosus TaxID=182803 RepID=A0A4Y2DT54_ARAVE|nr:hypothetical protein AVEN_237494-1 [Araneus ventricosus]